MPSTKGAKSVESPIKPWHIGLFVLAAILIAWQVFGLVRQNAASGTSRVVQELPTPGVTPPAQLAAPGSGTSRMFEEKDRP